MTAPTAEAVGLPLTTRLKNYATFYEDHPALAAVLMDACRALSAVPDDGLGSNRKGDLPTGEAARALANLDPAEFRRLYDEAREWSGSAWLACEKIPAKERERLQSEMYSWTCRLGNYFMWWADMAEAVAREQAAPSPSVPTGDAEGAVVGLEQWGWRVRFKANIPHRDAGPWSWQREPLTPNTMEWAEQEPVFVAPATPAGSE